MRSRITCPDLGSPVRAGIDPLREGGERLQRGFPRTRGDRRWQRVESQDLQVPKAILIPESIRARVGLT